MIQELVKRYLQRREVEEAAPHVHTWVPIRRGFPQMICRCGAMKSRGMVVGENTITVSPAGVGDVIRWSATKAPVAAGDIGMNVTTGNPQAFVSAAARNLAVDDVTGLLAAQTTQFIPRLFGSYGGNATRVTQTTFEGCAVFLDRPVSAGKLLFRVTGYTATGSLRICLFQNTNGLTGVAARVATITGFDPGGTGNFTQAFAEGTVNFSPGLLYILFGRDSAGGSVTLRTLTTTTLDLLTQNVDAAMFPIIFTTALAATASPASVTPTTDFTASNLDLTPITILMA